MECGMSSFVSTIVGPLGIVEPLPLFVAVRVMSSSAMAMVSVPDVHPAAEAVIVTVCNPSIVASSFTVRSKVAEAFTPAGIVIVPATSSAAASLDVRATTKSSSSSSEAATVPAFPSTPAPSTAFCGTVSVSVLTTFSALRSIFHL